MHLFTKEELIDETHKLMFQSPSFKDFLEAIALNCELNAGKLRCYPYDEHQAAADEWDNLSDKIKAIHPDF